MSSGKATTPNFEALFEASPNAYLLLDTDLRIVEANDAYLEVTGKKREELLHQHVFEAFPGDPEGSADANKERIQASLKRVLSSGEQQSIALMPYVISRETDEGEIKREERYWSVTFTPIFGEDEEVEFILNHSSDVTELYKGSYPQEKQKGSSPPEEEVSEEEKPYKDLGAPPEEEKGATPQQNQERLLTRAKTVQQAFWETEKERERLQRLFDQAPSFMAFLKGPDHVFEVANEAYYQVVGHRDIIGKPVREALPEVIEQGFLELLDQVYETGEPFVGREVEVGLQREPDEELETVYLDFIYQPVTGPDDETIGIFVQGHDVTGQKEAKDKLKRRTTELKELNETLEERVDERTRQVRKLTSHVTRAEQRERRRIARHLHDNLQQRLYGSQLRVQSLRDSLEERGQAGLASEAEAAEDGIEKVIRSLRQLSVGMSPPVLEREGLTAALEWLQSHMEETWDLEVELEAEPEFQIEEEMRVLLFQTARELLSNVAKHAGVGKAFVHLFKEEGDLVLKVKDEGEGFDPEKINIRDPEGSFGLTAARERLRLFDGNLMARSVPGKGTQVTVRLPLERNIKPASEALASSSTEEERSDGETQKGEGQKK